MSETPDLRAALERIRDDDPDDSEDRWITSARLRTIAAAALAATPEPAPPDDALDAAWKRVTESDASTREAALNALAATPEPAPAHVDEGGLREKRDWLIKATSTVPIDDDPAAGMPYVTATPEPAPAVLDGLPERVVVGANGAYWRDFGTHYSMCPVSDDNDPVEPIAVYRRDWSREVIATPEPVQSDGFTPYTRGLYLAAVNRLAELEATPEPAPCRCEHPFSDHRTPGTECAVIGCDCEPYEPAPAVLDVERLTDQKAALLELIALMAKAIGDATFLVGTDGATTTLLVFGKGSPLGTDGLPLPPGQIVAGTGEPDGLVSALAKAMELVGTDNVELVRMPAALTATPSEAKP